MPKGILLYIILWGLSQGCWKGLSHFCISNRTGHIWQEALSMFRAVWPWPCDLLTQFLVILSHIDLAICDRGLTATDAVLNAIPVFGLWKHANWKYHNLAFKTNYRPSESIVYDLSLYWKSIETRVWAKFFTAVRITEI